MSNKQYKKETIYEDYENMISDVLSNKNKVKSEQNLKDLIKQALRLACDPRRAELKKQAAKDGIKNEQIHHESEDDQNDKKIAQLAGDLIDGKTTPKKAIEDAVSCMEALSDKDHAKRHQKKC